MKTFYQTTVYKSASYHSWTTDLWKDQDEENDKQDYNVLKCLPLAGPGGHDYWAPELETEIDGLKMIEKIRELNKGKKLIKNKSN